MKREFGMVVATFSVGIIILVSGCSSKTVREANAVAASSSGGTASNDGLSGTGISELQTIYFPYDAANLTKEARETLKKSAEWMKEHPTASIQIEGNCDERGSVEYNLALGERRANAVKNYLTKLGIEASRLNTISYGKEHPVDNGHDESAWSKNRRADTNLLSTHLSQAN